MVRRGASGAHLQTKVVRILLSILNPQNKAAWQTRKLSGAVRCDVNNILAQIRKPRLIIAVRVHAPKC